MNGRVYDPLTAMFFSPDPYVQAPGSWLNYNRYGYCYGNPFKYTDPSGEFVWFILSTGWSVGFSPQMGFPISTNFFSVGANYNITHDSWSGNISAWGVDKNGWTFNPSVSVMVFPEHTTNLVRGKGFNSNDKVLPPLPRDCIAWQVRQASKPIQKKKQLQ